jgi:hypothetical protein
VEAEAERIGGLDGRASGLQVARYPCCDQALRLVDVQIDEAREDEAIAARVAVFDFDDEIVLDRERTGLCPTDRVDENSL